MENNDVLLKDFIGKNYEKITKNKFNVAGFFFTSFYMFYRKMVLYGFLCILIQTGLVLVFKNFYVGLILNILIGLFVNKIYLIHANKKVDGLKNNNKDKNMDELTKICKNKGGTSVGYIFIALLINGVINSLLMYYSAFGIFKQIMDLINGEGIYIDTELDYDDNNIVDDDFNNYGNDEYNGMLMFKSDILVKDKFTITVPSVFSDNSTDYEFNYSYDSESEEIFNTCQVKMDIVDGFSTSEVLIKGMHDYNKDNNPTDIENFNINGITWSSFNMEDAFGKEYFYATTLDNYLYLVEYDIQIGADNNCETYRSQVINSIKNIS